MEMQDLRFRISEFRFQNSDLRLETQHSWKKVYQPSALRTER